MTIPHRRSYAGTAAAYLICLTVLAVCFPETAYAVSGESDAASGLAGTAEILKNTGIAMAAAALAVTGVQALAGSAQDAVKLWPRILLIIAALAALLIVPYMIRIGRDLTWKTWEPPVSPSQSTVSGAGGWGEFTVDSVPKGSTHRSGLFRASGQRPQLRKGAGF